MTFFSVLQTFLKLTQNAPPHYSLKNLLTLKDQDGNTPLHFAAYRGNIDIINELIKRGCDIEIKNNSGLTVMHMAAQGDRPNVLVYFKEKYNLNYNDKDYSGSTPLHWACYMSSENALNYLISWIDDVNVIDNKGQTPLHIAIFSDRINIIKKLLNKGADTSIRDSSGKTVYDITKENSNLENIFRLLIDYKPLKAFSFKTNTNNVLYKSYLFSFLSIICELLTFFVLVPYLHSYFFSGLYIVFAVTFLLSYFYMTMSDPGIMISNYYIPWLEIVENKIDIGDLCPYCKVHKGQYVKHCHCCGHCIENFDHHCHWINNCIGEKNSNAFVCFLIVLIGNLAMNYLISFKIFLIKEKGLDGFVMEEENAFVLFGFLYVLRVKDILSLFIMTINLFFIVPVCYVLYCQFRNKNERRSRKKLAKSF